MKLLRGLLIIVVVLVSAILAPILWQRAASPARFRPTGKRLADYLAS